MSHGIKTSGLAFAAVLALSGCDVGDLLEVENPNKLSEASVRDEAAANAVVNGSQVLVAQAVSAIWQPYLVASDEMYWIGSRDAWGQLDQGFVGNPENEFTDGAFPTVGQGRWMADEAVEILEEHVKRKPGSKSFQKDLARAYLFAGIMYMIIGEVQEDFAFSDKTKDGPPLGPQNMNKVLDQAIAYLDKAVTGFQQVGDATLELRALAVRARAKMSRAIWDKLNPRATVGGALSFAAAAADAGAAIAKAGGVTADWEYNFTYSAASVANNMAAWINGRKENQIDVSLVTVNPANDINGIRLRDPIDNVPDPALIKRLNLWKGEGLKPGSYLDKGGPYAPLTITSTRLMHLILAEDELAKGNTIGFTTHINHIRAMDRLTPFAGQIPNLDMLRHTRRVNTLIMGLRLADMYRWGIKDPKWQPNSDAIQTPGALLPITIIEIRANCYLNGRC